MVLPDVFELLDALSKTSQATINGSSRERINLLLLHQPFLQVFKTRIHDNALFLLLQ